ncbi:MAG TPA: 3-dehydroquinate synthase [Opitutus sp.]|nr:3-dehydroquinate synthase [Opitutus sp.]
MAETLQVELGSRSYAIVIGDDVSGIVRQKVDALREAGRAVVVVTDANLAAKQAPAIAAMFGDTPRIAVAPGEGSKSLHVLGNVLDFLAERRVDRTGAVIAFGGGVVGDLAGYAAAAWLRGVDSFQVPTSLLAMVDSSVGGKTGINLRAGKNLVGAFHQPQGVFIGTEILATLPPREFAAGAAEIIKTGLLGDAELFAELEREALRPGGAGLARVIRRCCELKARVVECDEHETAANDGRALLNLGHTFGHAIEQVTAYRAYLHGEAVAIGLCAAARLSQKLGRIPAADVARIERVVAAHALPTRLQAPLATGELMQAMTRDKKVRAGKLRFVALAELGRAVTTDDVSPEIAEACWREVGAAG